MTGPSHKIAISAGHLATKYRLFARPGDRIRTGTTFGFRDYRLAFAALKDLWCDIRKDPTLDIIGRENSRNRTTSVPTFK